jgi:hypothetical protein
MSSLAVEKLIEELQDKIARGSAEDGDGMGIQSIVRLSPKELIALGMKETAASTSLKDGQTE